MRLTMVVVALVLMTGCTASGRTKADSPAAENPSTAESPSGQVTDSGPSRPSAVAGEACDGTPALTSAGFLEVHGISQDAELWGLLFAEVPFERGQEVKIVWRMTGAGPFKASASLPSGERAEPVWLEDHGGSNWQRPGYEWGTGWVFPKAGCWKVELSRTRGSGHVWLRVVNGPAHGR